MTSPWNFDTVAALKRCVADGLSSGEAATALNRQFPGRDFTRSAVIGKAHRLGLGFASPSPYNHHSTPDQPAKVQRPPAVRTKPRPQNPIAIAPPARPRPLDGPIGILDLRSDSCRWPVDHGGATRYCGLTSDAGLPYCPAHMKQSHRSTA